MSFHEISQASSLNPGADLWVISEQKNSKATRKIDWLLNFHLTKSSRHETKTLPDPVNEILRWSNLETPDWSEKKSPHKKNDLLVLSTNSFPNRWVMVAPDCDPFPKWIDRIFERWQKMGCPSVRIFLPTGISNSQFESAWRAAQGSGKDDIHKIGFVLES